MLSKLIERRRLGDWSAGRPTVAKRYVLAVTLAAAATLLRLVLTQTLIHDTPLTLSILAVVIAAWCGGFAPGLLTALLSAAAGIVLSLPPWNIHSDLTVSGLIRIVTFVLTSTVISGLTEALHHTTNEWRRAEQDKETQILQERNRLAREIHDTLAQGLTGIIVQLQVAEDALLDDPEEAREYLRRAENLARESLAEARQSVHSLRPDILNRRGLPLAFAHYIEQMAVSNGVRIDLTVEGLPPSAGGLPADLENNLLRIGLEALTNAIKHAHASQIRVALSFARDEIRLSVKDDGRGFSLADAPSEGGFGLTTMRERAERIDGQFQLQTEPGQGTEIVVVVPSIALHPPALRWGKR